MSMLGDQAKQLRMIAGDDGDWVAGPISTVVLREAADTIESLRGKPQRDEGAGGNEKKLVTIALQLVRDHYENDDAMFDSSCKELEEWCYDHGEIDLAEFAMACRCPACAFVPMEEADNDYYIMKNGKKFPVELDYGFLGIMPITIKVGGFRYLLEVPDGE